MKEKKILRVDSSSSRKIGGWKTFYQIFAWLSLIGGIITAIIGFADGESDVLNIGLILFATSLVLLFNTALLGGLGALVENAEYQKAIVEEERKIVDINTEIEEKSPAKLGGEEELQADDSAKHKFHVGQLMIVKENQTQFKVTDIVEGQGGITLYYSGKLDKYFKEEEIEDFAEYWNNKKN